MDFCDKRSWKNKDKNGERTIRSEIGALLLEQILAREKRDFITAQMK
jgi:hypothetical protein